MDLLLYENDKWVMIREMDVRIMKRIPFVFKFLLLYQMYKSLEFHGKGTSVRVGHCHSIGTKQ